MMRIETDSFPSFAFISRPFCSLKFHAQLCLGVVKDSSPSRRHSTSKQTHFIKVCPSVDFSSWNLSNYCILRKGAATHKMKDFLSIFWQSTCSIRHFTLTLSWSDGWTQVGLRWGTKNTFMFPAFWCVARNDYISNNYTGDTLSNAFNNCCSFMARNEWKQSLGVMTIQSVNICVTKGIADNLEWEQMQEFWGMHDSKISWKLQLSHRKSIFTCHAGWVNWTQNEMDPFSVLTYLTFTI